MWYGLFVVEIELFEVGFASGGVRLSIFPLVLALLRDALKGLDGGGRNGAIANELVEITSVTT